MNAHFKKEWVAALRSDQYSQTTGSLRDQEGSAFCCLGVACDLIAKKGAGKWFENGVFKIGNGPRGTVSDESSTSLPYHARYFMGITGEAANSSDPELGFRDRDGNQVTLIVCNDGGCTFPQIADLIEHLLPEFADEEEDDEHILP